ncbi:MAG: nucleotide exchange factor GrpE [Candidatus Cryptobacteroides sp.]
MATKLNVKGEIYMENINNEEKDLKQEENASVKEEAKTEKEEPVTGKEGKASRKEQKAEKKASAKVAELEKRITELEEKNKGMEEKALKDKDDYIRLMAEFDNFRRRTSQEKLDLVSTASEDIIKGILPILDDFERAVKALAETEDSASAKEGTELIYNKLMNYLKSKGLARIETEGKDFDTDFFEAVAQFPVQEEEKKGKVFDVVQAGYTLNGKVIRFAKVVVGI